MGLPAVALPHPATIADIEALPAGVKGEILDGVLYAMTRPRGRHQVVLGRAVAQVSGGLERAGREPSGRWWIVPEPGIELPRSPEVSPDVAGWRRERLPTLPADGPIAVVPDWVCEVLSPTTRRYDQLVKRPFYARHGVEWLWIVDVEAQLLTVSRLVEGRWVELGVYGDEHDARVEPFAEVALDLGGWWQGLEPGAAP